MSKITHLQVLRIAKWLGNKYPGSANGVDCWLSSPEGEVAMLDKLGDKTNGIVFNKIQRWHVSFPDLRSDYEVGEDITFSGAHENRSQALQLAILEMLGKEEG